jgi:hypothetical protein
VIRLCIFAILASPLLCQDAVEFQKRFEVVDIKRRYLAFLELRSSSLPEEEKGQLVIRLLARERAYLDSPLVRKAGVTEGYSESFYSTLLGDALVEFEARPTEVRFEELMLSSLNADSSVAQRLSAFAQTYPAVLKRLSTTPNQYTRLNVFGVGLLACRELGESNAFRIAIMRLVRKGLVDRSSEVRVPLMFHLSTLGGPDVHRMLIEAKPRIRMLRPAPNTNELRRLEDAIAKTKVRAI